MTKKEEYIRRGISLLGFVILSLSCARELQGTFLSPVMMFLGTTMLWLPITTIK